MLMVLLLKSFICCWHLKSWKLSVKNSNFWILLNNQAIQQQWTRVLLWPQQLEIAAPRLVRALRWGCYSLHHPVSHHQAWVCLTIHPLFFNDF